MAVLTVSTSASEIVVAKLNKYLRYLSGIDTVRFIKTPSLKRLGVFVSVVICLCLSGQVSAQLTSCAVSGKMSWAQLETVVDGDTLVLSDGRKVRVIAANTPELSRDNKRGQPLADEAKAAVINFFRGDAAVGLQVGLDATDRYGRLLAHVFRSDGASLAEYLIARGLAWHLVIPPNDRYWQCLQRVEVAAHKQLLGLWSHPEYVAKSAKTLTTADSGFQRIHGVVQSVSRGGAGWWLQMGELAVRLQDSDLVHFDGFDPNRWLRQAVTIRGWVIDRSHSRAVKNKGYPPLMISLRHPAMLDMQ